MKHIDYHNVKDDIYRDRLDKFTANIIGGFISHQSTRDTDDWLQALANVSVRLAAHCIDRVDSEVNRKSTIYNAQKNEV